MQPFGADLPPTGPVVSSSSSRRPMFIVIGVALLAVVVTGIVGVVVLAGDDPTEVTAGDGQAESGFEPEEPPGGLDPATMGDEASGQAGPGTEVTPPVPTTTAPPTTAPALVPGNLLTDGSGPAIEAIRDEVGRETRFTEVVVYDTYVIATYQNPAEPENIDRVTWRDGTVSAPDPVGFSADYTEELFSLGEVDLTTVPDLAQQAIDGFALAEGEVSHVIVDRFFSLEGELAIRVYVSDPVRGGGGYLVARGDGTVVDLVG